MEQPANSPSFVGIDVSKVLFELFKSFGVTRHREDQA
jgi:hypothetical protein